MNRISIICAGHIDILRHPIVQSLTIRLLALIIYSPYKQNVQASIFTPVFAKITRPSSKIASQSRHPSFRSNQNLKY